MNYNENYQPKALRYEVGEHSNFILVPMLLNSLNVLNKLGAENIKNYCDSIVTEPIQNLVEHEFWVEDSEYRASNLFGIRLPDTMTMQEAKSRLDRSNVFVSYRGDCIRISPNIFNTQEDLEVLVHALIG